MSIHNSSAVESIELLASLDTVATLLRVVCDLSGLKFAAVAEVTDQRWTACAVHDQMNDGLAIGTELELEATFCSHVRSSHDPVVIADVEQDPVYCDHPLPKLYGWGSYVSVPVFRPNGTFFGTLCGFDRVPAPLLAQPSMLGMLEGFARLLGEMIAREEQRRDETPGPRGDVSLHVLREQLLVLLEEDLHSPLQRLTRVADELAEQIPAVRHWQTETRRLARRSAEGADFIRARLGHGLLLKPTLVKDVNERIGILIADLVIRYPDRELTTALPALPTALRLDLPRLLQALEAVLEFGVAGTAPGGVIHLKGEIRERAYRLQVEYPGTPLEPGALTLLFQPTLATAGADGSQHLELGLYLAQEIVRGHGGILTARPQDGRNLLTLTLPTALD